MVHAYRYQTRAVVVAVESVLDWDVFYFQTTSWAFECDAFIG
jgi:hypothetical protein